MAEESSVDRVNIEGLGIDGERERDDAGVDLVEGTPDESAATADMVVLLKVEQEGGAPLPKYLFQVDAIRDFIITNAVAIPLVVLIINDREVLLSFPRDVVVTELMIRLARHKEWYGVPCRIQAHIQTLEVLRKYSSSETLVASETAKVGGTTGGSVPLPDSALAKKITGDIVEAVSAQLHHRVDYLEAAIKDSQDHFQREIGSELKRELDSELKRLQESKVVKPPIPAIPSTPLFKAGPGKAPKYSTFSGGETPGKDEVSFAQWKYEIDTSRHNYEEHLLKEGIVKSLRGSAADLIRFLGPNATVEDILHKLQTNYGAVGSYHTLMLNFYGLSQQPQEAVQKYAGRLEKALSLIKDQFPGKLNDLEVEAHLKDRLFQGLRKSLRDTIRFEFKDKAATYNSVFLSAREAEAEEDKPPLGAKSKAAVVEGVEPIHSWGTNQVAMVMSAAVEPKTPVPGERRNIPHVPHKEDRYVTMEPVPPRDPRITDPYARQGQYDQYVPTVFNPNVRCYNCGGLGHKQINCPSPLNFRRGGGPGHGNGNRGGAPPHNSRPPFPGQNQRPAQNPPNANIPIQAKQIQPVQVPVQVQAVPPPVAVLNPVPENSQ